MEEKSEASKSKEQLGQLFDRIEAMLPKEAGFSKAEFEGPDIVLYMKNARAVYQDDSIVRAIASSIKKKLIIRSDESALMEVEKARELIKSIIPPEAVIANIKFMPKFSEPVFASLPLTAGSGLSPQSIMTLDPFVSRSRLLLPTSL